MPIEETSIIVNSDRLKIRKHIHKLSRKSILRWYEIFIKETDAFSNKYWKQQKVVTEFTLLFEVIEALTSGTTKGSDSEET